MINSNFLCNIAKKELEREMKMIDEFTIQKTFIDWARKQDFIALCFAVPNGFKSNPKDAMMMKREGLLPGIPDVFCLLKNGQWAIIEFKTIKGKLSPHQENIIKILKECGQNITVARSTREAVLFVKEIAEKGEN